MADNLVITDSKNRAILVILALILDIILGTLDPVSVSICRRTV